MKKIGTHISHQTAYAVSATKKNGVPRQAIMMRQKRYDLYAE
jgi:hypothetical protein